MKALFSSEDVKKYNRQLKKQNTMWIAICVAFAVPLVLSIVLWQNWGRIASQIVATLCTSVIGCACVYFVQTTALARKYCNFSQKMLLEQPKAVHTDGFTFAKTNSTRDGMTFVAITAKTDDGERLLYVAQGKTLPQNVTTLYVCDKFVVGYEVDDE